MPYRITITKISWLLIGWLTGWLWYAEKSEGQQVRFPDNTLAQNPSNPWSPSVPTGNPVIPPTSSTAVWPTPYGTGGPSYGPATVTPVGPPYGNSGLSSTSPDASTYGATIRPNSSPLLPPTSGTYPPTASSWNLGNWFGTSSGYNQPLPPGSLYGVNPSIPNSYPTSVYPNAAPPALFPNGYSPQAPSVYGAYPNPSGQGSLYSSSPVNSSSWNMNGPLMTNPVPLTSRFFVAPRFRHSWIAGDDVSNALGINDSDISLLFQKPHFFGSTQPLYVVPSFSLHLWDGPKNSVADLPGSAYAAFLDFGWETDPLRTFGVELGVRVGVFSDFNTFNGDSLRILGKIIGRIRLTPTATARIGAFWIDRNRIKLIPAVGILCVPNADTRFDLFFPEPKLSHYVSTFGNTDMWWYASGYYGGGAWTIDRTSGQDDSIDINDIRVVLGLEWGRNELLRQGHRFAFFEGGYVFNRELIYRYRPQDSIDLADSFMLRAGFIY